MSGSPPLIRVEHLSRSYVNGGAGTTALRDVTLAIDTGEFVAIRGPAGSGKSTLMNILGLLDQPSGGVYQLGGRDTRSLDADARAELRNRNIGFVFQGFHLLARTSARENVELPLLYAGVPRAERRRRASEALRQVGLADRLSHFPGQLSGGEQQRVAIARALVTDPRLILADEPTGSLDSRNGREILGLLQRLNEAGRTLVLVTHDSGIAACAPRRITMGDGLVVADQAQGDAAGAAAP